MNKIEEKIESLGGFKTHILSDNSEISLNKEEIINVLKKYFKKNVPTEILSFVEQYGAFTFVNEIEIVGEESIPIADDNNAVTVDNFYDFSDRKKKTSILNVLDRFSDNLPENLLPICEGEPGDMIVVGLKKENYGKIYYWYHEENKLFLLASNFIDFIEKMSIKNDEDEDVTDVKISNVSNKFLERLKKSGKL